MPNYCLNAQYTMIAQFNIVFSSKLHYACISSCRRTFLCKTNIYSRTIGSCRFGITLPKLGPNKLVVCLQLERMTRIMLRQREMSTWFFHSLGKGRIGRSALCPISLFSRSWWPPHLLAGFPAWVLSLVFCQVIITDRLRVCDQG